jgi:hypothetical protein
VRCREAPIFDSGGYELVQTLLNDWRLAGIDQSNFLGRWIDAHDLVPPSRKTAS